MIFHRHRRFLAANDPMRSAAAYGAPEEDGPPPDRHHAESAQHGLDADAYHGPHNKHPRHTTSVNWWCPLAILPFFCLVRDFVPDIMHILKDFFTLHYIPLFKGQRMPNKWKKECPQLVRRKGRVTKAARDEYAAKLKVWQRENAIIKEASEVFLTFTAFRMLTCMYIITALLTNTYYSTIVNWCVHCYYSVNIYLLI